jgi:hypothetical protein
MFPQAHARQAVRASSWCALNYCQRLHTVRLKSRAQTLDYWSRAAIIAAIKRGAIRLRL